MAMITALINYMVSLGVAPDRLPAPPFLVLRAVGAEFGKRNGVKGI